MDSRVKGYKINTDGKNLVNHEVKQGKCSTEIIHGCTSTRMISDFTESTICCCWGFSII